MIYRRFGRTGLNMPVFSCGGMRYQQAWQDKPLSEITPENQQNLEATIRRSIELGINHIETARGYGSSERQLGLILPRYQRDQLIVQTKIAPSEKPADFEKNFEESLVRLQLDHVDLLALHGLNNEQTVDWAIRPGGCLAAARRFQKRGLARHIGFSTHAPLEVILSAITHEADGGFDYVNLHWYYIFQHNEPAIAEATRRDMGVFIISPSDKGGKLYAPSDRLVELCAPLHPIIFNDLFCLRDTRVHTLSIGAARPSDFDLHVEALKYIDRLEPTLAPILKRLADAYNGVVEPEVRSPFALGFPRWQDAPGQMNLPVILWLRNLVRAFGMTDYGKMRYNLMGNGGHWFPGMKADKLDALDLSAVGAATGLGDRLKHFLTDAHHLMGAEEVKRLSQS